MRPNYYHTYQNCAHSTKRKDAPWRVTSGCENRARLYTGRHYELPNSSVCHTCPYYDEDKNVASGKAGNQ